MLTRNKNKKSIVEPYVYTKKMLLNSSFTKVKNSKIKEITDQKGVFALRNIKKYQLVLAMGKGADVTEFEYTSRAFHNKLSKDTGISFKKQFMIDLNFKNMNRKPKWYCLNHSRSPNLKLVHLKDGGAGWRAVEDIDIGSELFFKYANSNFKTKVNEFFTRKNVNSTKVN